MFATVRLRLGGVVAAALLAMSAAAARRDGRSRLSTPTAEASSPRRRPTWPPSAPALAGRQVPRRGLRGLQALGRGHGHPEPAAHRRRQLHAVRQDRRAATRWSATAPSCRCATTTACAGAATTPTAPAGSSRGNWLDSNDNRGIKWRIKGVGKFDSIGFFVSDAADVGGKFSIKVGDTLYRDIADGARLRNGNIHFVRILLPEAVDKLTIKLMHDIADDGFGIDGVVVGTVAPIPLPSAPASDGARLRPARRPPAVARARPGGLERSCVAPTAMEWAVLTIWVNSSSHF